MYVYHYSAYSNWSLAKYQLIYYLSLSKDATDCEKNNIISRSHTLSLAVHACSVGKYVCMYVCMYVHSLSRHFGRSWCVVGAPSTSVLRGVHTLVFKISPKALISGQKSTLILKKR